MKESTCKYLPRAFQRFHSSNQTLRSLILSRDQKYVTKLPLTTNIACSEHYTPTNDLVLPNINDIETLRLLSGNGSSSISPHDPRFSILLSKCLSNASHNVKLRTIQSIESFYSIFKRYQEEFTDINGPIYHDFNKLCQYFIECKQLGKGQTVLEFLFKSNAPKTDILFLTNYLNLRCGSDISLWNYKKYKIFDYMTISQLSHEFGKSGYLDKQLIQSFGYMKNITHLEQYINAIWNVSMHPTTEESVQTVGLTNKDLLYPTNDLLLSIMSSYYYNDGNISRAFTILDLFLKKYPDIALDHKFWYSFLKNCIILSKSTTDSNITQIWNAMKLWYGNVNDIPFDGEVLLLAYPILKENNNSYYANEIYNYCIGPYVAKNPNLSSLELKTVTLYQKYIIRKHIDKKHMGLARDFISKWAFSLTNKEDLVKLYQTRANVRKKKPVEFSYDDADDDDNIFTPLW